MGEQPAAPAPGRPDPYASFTARRARVVSLVLAVGVVLMCVALAFLVTGVVKWWDRAGFLAVGAIIAWFLYRQATVRADPTREGLTVRNLFDVRTVPWTDVLEVRYGGGRPWVQLELEDGDTLGVMAVQRADGATADAEASRLAALASAHGRRTP